MINCPSCKVGDFEHFYEVQSVPTNSCILLTSRTEALDYPRGDIHLGFCSACGFVSNTAFDQALTEYDGRYEESQEYSPTYNAFHRGLAQRLIDRYALRGKNVIEIGCGQGEFLNLLCELGAEHGIGFDPAYTPSDGTNNHDRVKVIPDFYSSQYASHCSELVCCKMTLEHIPATHSFVRTVRDSVEHQDSTVLFFQVPEATRVLRDCAFEDIYYEHCSYFSPGSLARLFRQFGFEPTDIATEYNDQYLTIEARLANGERQTLLPIEQDLETLKHYVAAFPAKFTKKQADWNARLHQMKTNHSKVVLWGSGSKATSFLTTLDVGDAVQYVVDINPARQGTYVAGTGHEIVAPEFLSDFQPDVVIIMNSIYRQEIGANLKSMGLSPNVIAL
jgi:hypothetical protein